MGSDESDSDYDDAGLVGEGELLLRLCDAATHVSPCLSDCLCWHIPVAVAPPPSHTRLLLLPLQTTSAGSGSESEGELPAGVADDPFFQQVG